MRMSRSGWALTALSAGLVALLAPGAAGLLADVGGRSFPDALMAVGSLVTLAIASWCLLVAAAVVLGGSPRLIAVLAPSMLRRTLLAGVAGALVVAPAHAGQIATPESPQHSVSGLPLPDRPGDVVVVSHTPSTGSRVAAQAVEVRRGDTLWAIAARALADDATEAEIAHATHLWHQTNRDVIGDDPDLIVPAQHLTPPIGKDLP